MGANIPLPALQITPYRPTDPSEALERAMRLKSMMQAQQAQQQEMQQRALQTQMMQQQLKDQQIFRDAWSSNDDWDSAVKYMRKNGASPSLLGNVEKMRVDVRQKALEADKTQQELDTKHNDWVVAQIDHLKQLPEAQRSGVLPLVQQQHAQMFPRYANTFPAQVPTDDQSLTMFRNLFVAHSQDVSDAVKQAEAAKNNAEAAKYNMEAAPLNVGALNAIHQKRWEVLHPGESLPDEYALQPGANKLDYDRIDRNLAATESAEGTKAQRDATNEFRRQSLRLAAQNANSRSRTADVTENRFERDTYGTVGGDAVPGGAVDAQGNPIGSTSPGVRSQLQTQRDQAAAERQRNWIAARPPAKGVVRFRDSQGGVHDIPQENLSKARKRDPGLQVLIPAR